MHAQTAVKKSREVRKGSRLLPVLVLFAALGSLTFSATEKSGHKWIGPDGKALPIQSDDEIRQFLLSAAVIHSEPIPTGVTRPEKVLLQKDGIQMSAVFRTVDIYKRKWDDPNRGVRYNFRDSYTLECAAYELSVLLGMDNIPPTVVREIDDTKGSLQLWIEGAMTEGTRLDGGVTPPNRWHWMMQFQIMQLFDQLIFNDDRNRGNLLIDGNWKVWLIDHTRSFRAYSKPWKPELVRYCERDIWRALRNLDESEVEEKVGPYLEKSELRTLLKRREALIEHIQNLIEKHGEKDVLFNL